MVLGMSERTDVRRDPPQWWALKLLGSRPPAVGLPSLRIIATGMGAKAFKEQTIADKFVSSVYNRPMQSNKASKKTRKIAEEPAPAASETSVAGKVSARSSKPRASKVDKAEISDLGSGNHRHKVDSVAPVEPVIAEEAGTKSMAATASAQSTSSLPAPSRSELHAEETARTATHEEIAKLAFSYWMARGGFHGSAEVDWLRAEKELTGSRS